MNKCAIYARVSSSEQVKGYSLDNQIKLGLDYATSNDLQVVRVYKDAGLSAKTAHRPKFQQMVRDALVGEFDVIIVQSFDRFARNLEDAVTQKSLLRSQDIEIISIMEPLDRDNPVSFIQEGIADLFAAYYSINLSAKVRQSQARAISRGHWPHSLPFGYRKVGQQVEVTQAGVQIRQAFEEFATGHYTLSQWAESAWQMGIRSSKGKKLRKTSWSRIFSNKFYMGIMVWAGLEKEGVHQPLVSQELWQRVQDVLLANNQGRRIRVKRSYLLSQLLWSVDAGAKMIGAISYGRNKEYKYYRSSKKSVEGKRHHILAEVAEQQVSQVLQKSTFVPKILVVCNWMMI